MSPSENDLRRALHDGDDDPGVDVQQIMLAGERRRAARRSRIGTGAAGGVLLAVLVSGGVLLAHTGGPEGMAGGDSAGGANLDRAAASSAAASSAAGAAAAPQTPASASRSAVGATCPATFPDLALPGGGGTGQFGARGRLFAEPVATITVCAYGTGTSVVHQQRLTTPAAQRLTTSLEAASTAFPACATPNARNAPTYRFALLPVGTDGKVLRTVTAELDPVSCPNEVTNGTAVRSLWRPPTEFQAVFGPAAASSTPGQVHGSPVRS